AGRQFETLAKVKDIHAGSDNKFRLMLEFIGESWKKQFSYWTQFINNELLNDCQDEFIEIAKEVSLLLQIVIIDSNNGQPLDQVFLADLQENIDILRKLIFKL